MIRILSLLAGCGLFLTGCDEPKYPKYETNQTKRHEYFLQCLAALPAGPQQTKYNDWEEVVTACSSAAYYQALYCYENCPPSEDKI